jgi:uncharacterized protein (DUF697 family)
MIGKAVRSMQDKARAVVRGKPRTDWMLVPGTQGEIDALRMKCRRIVMRRAAISAGVAVVPVPGLDIAADISLLARVIDEINAEFGLTPEQIERLKPDAKIIVYKTVVGMGGAMVGKLVTRGLVTRLIKRSGVNILARNTAKLVPLAGQVAAASLGFAAFRTIGYEHVEACAKVAEELMILDAKSAR